jgi:hypothetical protein
LIGVSANRSYQILANGAVLRKATTDGFTSLTRTAAANSAITGASPVMIAGITLWFTTVSGGLVAIYIDETLEGSMAVLAVGLAGVATTQPGPIR